LQRRAKGGVPAPAARICKGRAESYGVREDRTQKGEEEEEGDQETEAALPTPNKQKQVVPPFAMIYGLRGRAIAPPTAESSHIHDC